MPISRFVLFPSDVGASTLRLSLGAPSVISAYVVSWAGGRLAALYVSKQQVSMHKVMWFAKEIAVR